VKKMLAVLVHLSMHMWPKRYDMLPFDDAVWERTIRKAAQCGFNTIVLDVGDGIQFQSHPEIAMNGAWSRERVKAEVARCKAMGLALIPKLNFSAAHDMWLGAYREMQTTPTYHQVTGDLIREVYELFDHPEYIHLGMDEEKEGFVSHNQRPGALYWKDFRHLVDCVKATGARPWIWADPLFMHPLDYATHFAPDEAVLSPWYYHAFRREHFTPTDSTQEYFDFYTKGRFGHLKLRFVEDDPFHATFRSVALPLMHQGFSYVPCASVYNNCKYNTPEMVEYFVNGAPEDRLVGFMTAPWFATTQENWPKIEQSLELMGEAAKTYLKA